MYVLCMYYVCIIYVLYNACIKFLYLCVYTSIDLFFRATAHEITARNGANSKHNAHDDEDDVRNWHPFLYIVAYFYIS